MTKCSHFLFQDKKVALILLIGGSGLRLNYPYPKQFCSLDEITVFELALKNCLSGYGFNQVILPTHQDWVDWVKQRISLKIDVVVGGKTRQESSYKGLLACKDEIDYVMIHDGARPFVSKEIISNHIDELSHFLGVDTCIPTSDTIVVGDLSTQTIQSIPPRDSLYNGQTPQSFHRKTLLEQHEKALQEGITDAKDDCCLLVRSQIPVKIVQGSPDNIKITTPFDLEVAKLYHRSKKLKPADLTGKHYVIGGGGGVLGKEIQALLESLGAKTSIAKRIHLCDDASAKTFFSSLGEIDGVINCMGSLINKKVCDLSSLEINQLISDNFLSVVYSCKNVLLKKGGHILNIGSSSARSGRPDYALYSSSKAAVINFTEAIALDHPHLYINTLSPRRLDTPLRRKAFQNEDPRLLLDPRVVAEKAVMILQTEETGNHWEI